MMEVIIYAFGVCLSPGRPTQQASAVLLLSSVDTIGRKASRQIAIPLAGSSKMQADLQSIRLGLMSLERSARRTSKIVLKVSNKAVIEKLKTDEKSKDGQLVAETNKWIKMCPNLAIEVVDRTDPQVLIGLNLAKDCASYQKPFDTKTTM